MGTPTRSFRIDDDLWHAARLKAAHDGTNLTAVICDYLTAYVTGQVIPVDTTKGGHRD